MAAGHPTPSPPPPRARLGGGGMVRSQRLGGLGAKMSENRPKAA